MQIRSNYQSGFSTVGRLTGANVSISDLLVFLSINVKDDLSEHVINIEI